MLKYIKVTPFLLFLIILVVLVISVVLGGNTSLEGMDAGSFKTYGMQQGTMTCPANYYCVGDGTEVACPNGTGSSPGSTGPEACKSSNYSLGGKYKDVNGNVQVCPIGMYCPGSGNAIACPAGFNNTKTGLIDYADCNLTVTISDPQSGNTVANMQSDEPHRGITTSDSVTSNYFKWYWHWKNQTPGQSQSSSTDPYSDDYILKTQIVPPVCPTCPTCPNCPSAGICTNCGGNGGHGTLTTAGNTVVQQNRIADKDSLGRALDATGNVLGGAAHGAGDAVGGIAQGAGDAVGGVAKGVGNVAGGIVKGAGGLVGGTLNAAGQVIGGAIGGVEKIGAGIMTTNPVQVQYQGQGQGQGPLLSQSQGQSQGQTPYMGTQFATSQNYYGAVPAKESTDFMPVTANFSAFSK